MLQPGRTYSSDTYRYGFNGMEQDNEIKGEGNSYTTFYRMNDPRLGRWTSLDPLMSQFPGMSPYVAYDNNPIFYIDALGLAAGPAGGGVGLYEAELEAGRVEEYDLTEPTNIQAGNYTIDARYKRNSDGSRTLVQYVAGRTINEDKEESRENFRNEWIIDPDKIAGFAEKASVYEHTANLAYHKGFLSESDKKIWSGDFFGGLGQQWKEALKDPHYYVFLVGVFGGGMGGPRSTFTFDKSIALRNALSPFKGQKLTNAGRAVTKHPQYFGFENFEALMKVHKTPEALNTLAAEQLKNILQNGKMTTGAGGRYPNGWVTFTLENGNAASWNADGTFIGFRGVRK